MKTLLIHGLEWLARLCVVFISCGIAFSATVDVTYDDLHRVTQVMHSSRYSIIYTYDEVGNRVLRVATTNTTDSATPIAVTDTATFSSQTEVVLSAAVNPNGASTIVWMEWGTGANYGNTTAQQSVGGGNLTVNVTASIAGLSLGTTYHFRVVAQNSAGISYGENVSTYSGNLAAIYTTGTDVPLSTDGFTATGKTLNLSLNYAPRTGTELMVVKNTGLGFINGTFNDLAQGQTVALTFDGNTYNFVANYYGGNGNDLVLVWALNRAVAFGWNGYGQLGDGTRTNRTAPAAVPRTGVLAGKTVVAVAAGSYHTLALCSDGAIVAWGNNFYGQLGDNSRVERVEPVVVTTIGTALEGKTVVAIAAGRQHSLALCSDGTVAAWGDNTYGQLGNGTTNQVELAQAMVTAGTPLEGKKVVRIAAGELHNLALCSDGTLAGWGYNYYGQIGDGTTSTSSPYGKTTAVGLASAGTSLDGRTVVMISAGGYHSLALCSDGTLAAWGSNSNGQLGDGSTLQRETPSAVVTAGTPLAGRQVTMVAAGGYHSLALCSDGTVAAWGYNYNGQIGDGTTSTLGPYGKLTAAGLTTAGTPLASRVVVSIAAGKNHSLAFCSDGAAAAWGYNGEGELGDNTITSRSKPVAVQLNGFNAGERLTQVSSGSSALHTLSLAALGQIQAPELTIFTQAAGGRQLENNEFDGVGFANTLIGASSVPQIFTIRNTGSAELTGIEVRKAGSGDSGDFVLGSVGSDKLAPHAETTFTVTFSPTALGERTGVVQIASNDADENPFVIPVFGNGLPAMVVEQPSGTGLNDGVRTIGFSTVIPGSSSTVPFTIRNAGHGDLAGLGIGFEGINAADYSVTTSPVSPVVAGNSTTFTVRFSPTSPGIKTATLRIASNDAGANPFVVKLTGNAVPATPLTGTRTGIKITGNIFPAGDVDYYAFSAQAGDRVYAAVMTSFAIGSVDSEVRILGSDGTAALEYDDDDGQLAWAASSIAGVTIPSAGTYYARVNCKYATSIMCPYDLWLRVHSGAPTPETEPNYPAQELPSSGWVSGSLSSATDYDEYTVHLNAGDTVFLSLDLDPERDGITWNGIVGLTPFGSQVRRLVSDDASVISPNSEAFFMTVKDAGSYRVDVEAQAGDSTFGTYHLSVSVLPAVAQPSTSYTSGDVPKAIADGPSVVTSTITVPDSKRIGKLKVFLNLTHANMPDLDVSLTAPDGNTVGLFTDIGYSHQTNLNFGLDDGAATTIYEFAFSGSVVEPEGGYRLEWFKGQQAQGNWTLTIRDDTVGNGGTLNGWSLVVVDEDPLPAGTPTTLYSSDFEDDDSGFTHAGIGDEWQRGLPTVTPITTANSGTNCWKTDLVGTYNANSSQDLFPPSIDLSSVPPSNSIVFSWAMKYQMDNATWDHAFVEVQEMGGTNASRKVWEWMGPNMTTIEGEPTVTTQEAAGWGLQRAVISEFAGKTIRLRFHLDADSSGNYAGLAIDDVAVTAYGVAFPAMIVEQPVGMSLTDGVGTVEFGAELIGFGLERSFTVRNNGTANLTGLGVGMDGANAGDFVLAATGASTLAPGESTTFTVTFSPGAAGPRAAALHLTHNGLSANAFDIALAGTGQTPSPGMTITQTGGSTTVTEGGATDIYTIRLNAQPTQNVTVNLAGDSQVNVSQASLTFTTSNWHTAQAVTISAVNDNVAEGPHTGNVNHTTDSADLGYNGLAIPAVNVAITDNDIQGLVISTATLAVNEGGMRNFTVGLNAQPLSDVSVSVARISGDIDLSVKAGGTLNFSAADWSTPKAVTLSALEDPDDVHGQAVFTVSSAGLPSQTVTATEVDNDAFPEIAVERPAGTNLIDGTALVDFSTKLVGANADLDFKVRNTGTANLTGLGITIDGANAGDFSIIASPTTPVTPGGSTSFTVRFTPGAKGSREASLHLSNNDADENPFDIVLAGTGSVSTFVRPGSFPDGLQGWWKLNEPQYTIPSANGNAQIDTRQSSLGGASALFDGSGDFLSIPDSENWSFGNQDFTIEFRVKFSSIARSELYHQGSQSTGYSPVRILMDDGVMSFYLSATGFSWEAALNARGFATESWSAIALVRHDSTVSLYVDGILADQTTFSGNLYDSPQALCIGVNGTGGGTRFHSGWLDEYRISNLARYTTSYQPETTEFANDDHTLLLLHMNGTQGSITFANSVTGVRADSSGTGNNLTDIGGLGSANDDYWGTGERSADFESSAQQYLSIAHSSQTGLDLDGDSFTLAGWVKCESYAGGNMAIMNKGNWAPTAGYLWRIDDAGRSDLVINGTSHYGADRSVPLNKWVHLAIIRNLPARTIEFYVDGNLSTVTMESMVMNATTKEFRIGQYVDIDGAFDGLMKDVAVWDVALTPLQIKSLAFCEDLSTRAFRPNSIPNGLVSFWPLNEVSAEVSPIIRKDSGPGGNDLTDISNVAGDVGGFLDGSAARFVGQPHNRVGDYLKRSNAQVSDTLRIDSQTQSLTVAVWVFRTGSDSSDGICSMWRPDHAYRGFSLGVQAGGGVEFYVARGETGEMASAPNDSVQLGNWYHLTGVYDADAHEIRIYVDGKLRGTAVQTVGIDTSGSEFLVGSNGESTGSDYYTGRLSDLAIWNRALTGNEIVSLATGLPLHRPGIVSQWNLDETNGLRSDSIGSNNLSPSNGVSSAIGIAGNAAAFEQDNSQFLSIADAAQTGLDITNALTISAWVKPESTSGLTFLDKNGNGEGYNLNTLLGSAYSMDTFGSSVVSATLASAGVWQHIAGVWDGASKSIWINSKMEHANSQTAKMVDTTTDFFLGRHYSIGTRYWDGLVDEVLIAKRGFREEEIKSLYNLGLNGRSAFPPEIVIEQPAGAKLTNAVSLVDFGSGLVDAATNLIFTIRNSGIGNLLVFGVTLDGANAGDFSVVAGPAASVTAGGTSTFTVRFMPGSTGVRAATLHVASNDDDENPIDIMLTGIGLTPLENWRKTHFGSASNSGSAADAADSDHDGIPNFAEFAFGLDPRQNSSGQLPLGQVTGNDFVIRFTQPSGVAGVIYGAEWSNTLLTGSWTSIVDSGFSPQHVFSVPIGSTSTLFVRLKVTWQ